jgi:NAD(P)-dependent dehydrogenase (short-subunit alcohol dehydrogenase family)
VEKALSRFGRLDALINNAGFYNAKPMLRAVRLICSGVFRSTR